MTELNSGFISIKQMMDEQKQNTEREQNIEEDFVNRPRSAFDQKQLIEVWEEYISIQKNKGKTSFVTLLQTCDPKVGENFEIELKLDNKVQRNELKDEMTDFLGFIREKLNNWGVYLKPEIRKQEEKVRYYTNRERFDRIKERFPLVEELQKKLNFDPDY